MGHLALNFRPKHKFQTSKSLGPSILFGETLHLGGYTDD